MLAGAAETRHLHYILRTLSKFESIKLQICTFSVIEGCLCSLYTFFKFINFSRYLLFIISSVRVIFPYAATASDELNLVIGDMVSVHVKNPDGWYEGTLNGVRGLFPGNYVETLQ